MPYTAPTPEQARAFRRSCHRRQPGFIALDIASGPLLFAAIARSAEGLAALLDECEARRRRVPGHVADIPRNSPC
jgi:hypothetical protein